MPSLVNEWFYLSSARFLLVKTVQYSSQRGTPNLHLLSHPLTLRRCNLSNESNCIVCRDAPLEFLNLPWCPSPVTGIAVVPSLTQTFPRQELQCPMTNEIRPLGRTCQKGAWRYRSTTFKFMFIIYILSNSNFLHPFLNIP